MLQNQTTIQKKEFRKRMNRFRMSLKHSIATTRFNNVTWDENCKMREKNTAAKCIYATPIQISSRVGIDRNVFVLEMNNDVDQILGIGLIKNRPVSGKYAVHSVHNYNRFVYIGKWRIDKEQMSAGEKEIFKMFEAICFRGLNHSKRGQGITELPMKLQYISYTVGFDMMNYICEMFRKRMPKEL